MRGWARPRAWPMEVRDRVLWAKAGWPGACPVWEAHPIWQILMYSEENVYSRFKSNPPWKGGAHQFVCVRYDEGWKYDTIWKWIDFAPTNRSEALARTQLIRVRDLVARSYFIPGGASQRGCGRAPG